jgi:capsule polysaccharide modification protein KpsS
MARFILQPDYDMQIKQEIMKLLTAGADNWYLAPNLVRAEQTAIRQIKHWLSPRATRLQNYNLDAIFNANAPDERDHYLLTATIDLTLYHLYSQTGMKNIPEQRQQRYRDVLDWLKEVAAGNLSADLPTLTPPDREVYAEFIFQSRTPQNHKW